MNGIINVNAAITTNYDYKNLIGHMYNKTRVLKMKLKLTFNSLEASNYQTIYVVPTQDNAGVGSIGQAGTIAALPYAKHLTVSPLGSAGNSKVLHHSFKPERIIGPQYNEQDEYAGSFDTATDPVTLIYFYLCVIGSANNTVTTGGCDVIIEQFTTFELYELQRDNSITMAIPPDDIERIDKGIDTLQAAKQSLLDQGIARCGNPTSEMCSNDEETIKGPNSLLNLPNEKEIENEISRLVKLNISIKDKSSSNSPLSSYPQKKY